VFLGEILTELELQPDRPLKTNCGTCELCQRVCPTGAIVAPYTIDNNRCISYLTIEHRGMIPRDLRPLMGNWVFGCDACQEVCPPNLRAGAAADPAFRPTDDEVLESTGHPELIPLLEITQDEFTRRFSRTPVKRARREGLQRNAAVALGNSGDRSAVPALAKALREATPIVRGHAAWALGRLGGAQSLAALLDSMSTEQDDDVRGEIAAALAACSLDGAASDHV
jgi:epoxyqueuosine reductase